MIKGGKMKKIILICLIVILLGIGIILGINSQKQDDKNNNLKKVTLTEPTLT